GKIYDESTKRNLARGRSIEQLVAGSYWAAIKVDGLAQLIDDFTINVKEVINSSISVGNIHRAYSLIVNNKILDCLDFSVKELKNSDYANYYLSRVNITGRLYDMIMNLVKLTDKETGNARAGIIAAAIYLVSDKNKIKFRPELKRISNNIKANTGNKLVKTTKNKKTNSKFITQTLVADYMHVTEVTVRTQAKKLRVLLGL
ncbi:MAG: hypothetical protein WC307_05450, partial [Candidatus Nanoarchaeia archaeon]